MSSHREAPEISKDPVADNTDTYAFVSPDQPDTVTLITNYVPLEGPDGGPNFYSFGDDVLYEIHVDGEQFRGQQIDVSSRGNAAKKTHTDVLERRIGGQPIFAAVFPALAASTYILWLRSEPLETITILGGQVVEADWRTLPDIDGLLQRQNTAYAVAEFLPPRYHNGQSVCAAPMGSASLRYASDGLVAWNEMWTDFCDLALAGGPPHRGTLLEPTTLIEKEMDQDAYERVVVEIERGLHLVTGLSTLRSEHHGWVGLVCNSEEMAIWLLRAIVVENVCVRREENVLFLPASPDFCLEKEIKNVITVVAKTYHYWTEHVLLAYQPF